MSDSITIERKGDAGFETTTMSMEDALPILNNDIQNEMTVWIDSKPFVGEVLDLSDLQKCKKEISVTNRLVGG